MADPLSIGASIAGLITISAQICIAVSNFAKATIGAPKSVHKLASELKSLNLVFSEVQKIILKPASNNKPNPVRMCMIRLEGLTTILTDCVKVFSTLQNLVDNATKAPVPADGIRLWEKMKWAWNESTLQGLLEDLIGYKQNLSLMLNIVQWYVKDLSPKTNRY